MRAQESERYPGDDCWHVSRRGYMLHGDTRFACDSAKLPGTRMAEISEQHCWEGLVIVFINRYVGVESVIRC